MTDKYCPNCGEKRVGDAKFCGRCGYRFPEPVQPTQQGPPTAPSPTQQQPLQPQQQQQQQQGKPQYGGLVGPIVDTFDTMAKRRQWEEEQKRKRERENPAPHGTVAFETNAPHQQQMTQPPAPQRPIQPLQSLSEIPQSNINIFEGLKFAVIFGIICALVFPFIGIALIYAIFLSFFAFLLFSGILFTFLGGLRRKKKRK
jgi:hypothetical protein